jgi:HPt (histidine-containing phosphotransfer) domain-containing protein
MPVSPPETILESAIGEIEIAQLRAEFGGDIAPLVEIFQQETPALLLQMEKAFADGNADGIRRAAHALKGCCANFGARPIEALCQDMETLGESGDVARAAQLLDPVRRELRRVVSALTAGTL